MALEAARPCTVFTSIGKKVITMTTAALDGQSKPNHMTMIAAMPITGKAETKLPSGSSPRCRNGERSIRMAVTKPGAAAERVADQHGLQEVCLKSAASVGMEEMMRCQIADAAATERTARRSRAPRLPR